MTNIRLSKERIIELTNEGCSLLQNTPQNEPHVLVFNESGNDDVTVELYMGDKVNGKSDLFPRGTNPADEIYTHLACLYGEPGIF